ncbi:hypothetical protein OCJ37_16705 [Xanthomonas sp. AM6]|uniref:hypothetical protein n=1 Tax=Xanthomonas sp. AM6 TaxID=2982531 RepID=UPI0021D895A6|nr:hypothetical protein [Xanthomonas sp. AM6]UYB51593.1 hypothetical protein OCJ37_16705 [Xanthomonas sp. AM6]
MSKPRLLLIGLGCIAALAVAVIAGYKPLVIWLMHTHPFSAETFDAARWRVGLPASEGGECVRGRMANDIIARIARPGLPRSAVEAALGVPQDMHGEIADYELGMCSGLRIDFDSLYVEYADGKVLRAYHVQH